MSTRFKTGSDSVDDTEFEPGVRRPSKRLAAKEEQARMAVMTAKAYKGVEARYAVLPCIIII